MRASALVASRQSAAVAIAARHRFGKCASISDRPQSAATRAIAIGGTRREVMLMTPRSLLITSEEWAFSSSKRTAVWRSALGSCGIGAVAITDASAAREPCSAARSSTKRG